MSDTECHWQISESLCIQSKGSELDTPWAGAFTFAEFVGHSLCYTIFGALSAFIRPDTIQRQPRIHPLTHLQHIQICNQLHQVPEAEFPALNAWQKLGCHFLEITLSLWRKQTGPGQRLHQAQPTTSAVEHQKCKSQNEGEESQGFLSTWQCWK